MENIVKTLLFFHISSGFISLVLFWRPVFLKKGGKGHRIAGKGYVFFMWIVVISATLLSVKNVIIGKYFMACFLGFIALITANPLWYGMVILKKDKLKSSLRGRLIYEVVVLFFSLGLVALGFQGIWAGNEANVLLFVFGGLGLTSILNIMKLRKTDPEKTDRIKDHMVGLLTSGIAAYTAFFVFGAYTWVEQYLPGMWGVLPWVAPGLIGGLGINYGVKYFRKKGMIKDRLKTAQTTS
ncbi:MAG TPA: hypothetical protein DCR04_08990 [Flavobacteriales bacterium]|nr:hypothetical protein [Flavobacteriales bacterium]